MALLFINIHRLVSFFTSVFSYFSDILRGYDTMESGIVLTESSLGRLIPGFVISEYR